MSKSLGNSLVVAELLRRWRPVELRYYLSSAHYRSTMDYTEDALAEAGAAFRRVEGFLARAAELVGETAPGVLPAPFSAAMDDDLAVPQALAVVHGAVRDGNTALDAGDRDTALELAGSVRAMTGILGLDPLDPHWAATTSHDAATSALAALVDDLLAQRQDARSARDFATADGIRGRLTAAGVSVEDSPDGPTWSLKDT